MTARTYYSNAKVNGRIVSKTGPLESIKDLHTQAKYESIGIGNAGIVVVHSCRWMFNDILGFWVNGKYFTNRNRTDLIEQHLNGRGK